MWLHCRQIPKEGRAWQSPFHPTRTIRVRPRSFCSRIRWRPGWRWLRPKRETIRTCKWRLDWTWPPRQSPAKLRLHRRRLPKPRPGSWLRHQRWASTESCRWPWPWWREKDCVSQLRPKARMRRGQQREGRRRWKTSLFYIILDNGVVSRFRVDWQGNRDFESSSQHREKLIQILEFLFQLWLWSLSWMIIKTTHGRDPINEMRCIANNKRTWRHRS